MNRLKVFLLYPNKKPIFRMLKEVIVLIIKKREIPYYYFKYLYRNRPNAVDFMLHASLKEQRALQYHSKLHNPKYSDLLDNKFNLSRFCSGNNLPTPRIISLNNKNKFMVNGKEDFAETLTQLQNIYESILEDKDLEGIFFRPFDLDSGRGCFKITTSNFKEVLNEYFQLLIDGDYIHTEVVKQHPKLNTVNDKALNTIRLITLITEQGNTEIIFSSIRFGVGDSVTDNASAGGFFVKIDNNTGKLVGPGYFLPQFGGDEISHHPISGVALEGFEIPFYDEMKTLVYRAVELIPDRLIGWDIGVSEIGPLIIEANRHPHIQGANIALGGILKNPRVKEVLETLK